MSKELGWNKMFNLMSAENKTQVTPRIWANKLPFKVSMAFQTTTRVKAPNKAGKNRTQNTVSPNRWIRYAIHEFKGGIEIYPQAKCCPWSRYRYSSLCKSYSEFTNTY